VKNIFSAALLIMGMEKDELTFLTFNRWWRYKRQFKTS